MKKTRFLSSFLCFILILNSFCFGAEGEELIVEDKEVTMTLDEAVDYALAHNPNVIDIDKLSKDQKELYDNAKDTYMIWKEKVRGGGYSFEEPAEYLACWGYTFELAKLGYDSFLATKTTAEETVSYSVKQIAYSIDELEKSLELLEKTVNKQETDVKIAEVKNSLNMITALDVEATRQTLISTKLQLASLETTLSSLRSTLKNVMGFDVEKDLNIVLPENLLNILEVENLDKVIEDSLETNNEVITAKLSYKPKENNYILATKTHFLLRDEIKDAKKDYSDAELRLNNSINTVKNNLYSLYTTVKNSEESVILAKSEYEQLCLKYKQMQVMHELGMITTHDYNSYEIALMNAKNTYEAELHKNILLNDRWNIALKVGDVLAKED